MRRTLALCLLLGCAAATLAPQARAEEKFLVQTGSLDGIHAALYLAIEKGWFKDAGFDVTVADGKGSATAIQEVAAGQGDVAYSQLATMATAIDRGMDLTSVAGFVRAGDNGLTVGLDTDITEPKGLAGKRIAYATGTASAALLDGFLHKVGLNRDQLDIIAVDPSALPGTYVSHAVDGAINTVSYFLPIVAPSRPSRAIAYSDVGIRVPGVGLVIRKSDEDANAAKLARFVPVAVHAWQYIFENHVEEAADAMIAQRPNDRLDRLVLIGQIRAYMTAFDTPATKGKGIGWQSEEDWTGALADLKAARMIEKDWKARDFYINRFLAKN